MSAITLSNPNRKTVDLARLAAAWLAACLAFSLSAQALAQAEPARHSRFLPNQKLPGMDYRHFRARGGADECFSACSIEPQCKSWSYNPSKEMGGVVVPVCYLKSGIPQREYARGYVSGIKPPPPAVGRHVPPPPVVQR